MTVIGPDYLNLMLIKRYLFDKSIKYNIDYICHTNVKTLIQIVPLAQLSIKIAYMAFACL